MKAIEGIVLAEELKSVEAESFEEQRKKLRIKIAMIKGHYSTSLGSVAQCRKALEKAEDSLKKHEQRLAKLVAGDWSVLEDDKQDNQPKTQSEAQ